MKERITLDIVDMNESGQGVAKQGGIVHFVNGAILGDKVEAEIALAKKNYKVANAVRILEASEQRKPGYSGVLDSPYGLSLQAMKYEKQLEYKERLLFSTIDKLAGIEIAKKNAIIGLSREERYRNKGVFPIREDGGIIKIGAFERASHKIVEVLDNPAMPESYAVILTEVKALAEELGISAYNEGAHRGALKFILIRSNAKGEHLIASVLHEDEPAKRGIESAFQNALLDKLREKGIPVSGLLKIVDTKRSNVALGGSSTVLSGEAELHQKIEEVEFKLGIHSFFQVSTEGVEKLYNEVFRVATHTNPRSVWDIYCGVGSIGIYLAKKWRDGNLSAGADLRGLEMIPEAIEYAKENARINGIQNAYFERGKAEDLLASWVRQYASPDLIILDPPRKGVEKSALDAVTSTGVKHILYVSCKPSTLARDLKILCEAGYRCLEITPVDLFPMSMHVETVCLLSKSDADV